MHESARAWTGCIALSAIFVVAPRWAPACVPITTQAKLVAEDAESSDEFGRAVSISGDLALVGAYGDDDAGDSSGAALVFEREAEGLWRQVAKLAPEGAGAWQRFGASVAISGRRALVGSAGFGDGKAHVFEPDAGGSWSQVAELVVDDPEPPGGFARSLSLSGDWALVGASGDDHAGAYSGSAYLFLRDGGGEWSQAARLTADDAIAGQSFGSAVAVDEDRAVVGAPGDEHQGPRSGSAYVFERDAGGDWIQVARLVADDAGEQAWFGASVSISGDVVIVGSWGDDEPAGPTTGSAYVFERDLGGDWIQVAKLRAFEPEAGGQFGWSVSVSGDRAIVGSLGSDEAGRDSGSAHLFGRDAGGRWSQLAKLTADDAAMDDGLGVAVSISADRAIVGAAGDDDAGSSSGSAYVFERHCYVFVRRGTQPDSLSVHDRVEGSTWTDTAADAALLYYRLAGAVAPDLRVHRSSEGPVLTW